MSDELKIVSVDDLEFNDAARVEWVRVQDAAGLLWKDNPKRHDLGAIIESIKRYGFQERPKFDVNLPNVTGGTGAIVAGNGRVEALAAMERDKRYELPRGLAAGTEGAWCMPLLVGTDATSEEMAAAYGLDANNLTLAGGDAESSDYFKMYSPGYTTLLRTLSEHSMLPITVEEGTIGPMERGMVNAEPLSIICLSVLRETRDRFFDVLGKMFGETENERLDSLIDVVYVSVNT